MPHILHPVYARAASRAAPPKPPTTPPMIALLDELRPELPLLLPPCASAVGAELVVTGTSVLVVLVPMTVLPPCTDVYVCTI